MGNNVEEFLVKNGVFNKPEISQFNLIIHRDTYIQAQKNIKKAMIEFAKWHVARALHQANNSALIEFHNSNSDTDEDELIMLSSGRCHNEEYVQINIDSILDSYPLENIK